MGLRAVVLELHRLLAGLGGGVGGCTADRLRDHAEWA